MVPLPDSKLLLGPLLQLSGPALPSLEPLILGSLLLWPLPRRLSAHSSFPLASLAGLLGFRSEGLLSGRPAFLTQPMQAPAMAPAARWPLAIAGGTALCDRPLLDSTFHEGRTSVGVIPGHVSSV